MSKASSASMFPLSRTSDFFLLFLSVHIEILDDILETMKNFRRIKLKRF